MGREERWDQIFQLWKKGKNTHEIIEIVGDPQKRTVLKKKRKVRQLSEIEQDRRGERSEKIAEERLQRHFAVSSTTRYSWFSEIDRDGVDIRVKFNKTNLRKLVGGETSIIHCKVQVKSCDSEVEFFKNQFGDTEQEISSRLARKNRVVLNARASKESFYTDFEQQVKFINDFHTRK